MDDAAQRVAPLRANLRHQNHVGRLSGQMKIPLRVFEQHGGREGAKVFAQLDVSIEDRKSTRLNSSHANISYAVFCLKKKTPLPASFHLPILLSVSFLPLFPTILFHNFSTSFLACSHLLLLSLSSSIAASHFTSLSPS